MYNIILDHVEDTTLKYYVRVRDMTYPKGKIFTVTFWLEKMTLTHVQLLRKM